MASGIGAKKWLPILPTINFRRIFRWQNEDGAQSPYVCPLVTAFVKTCIELRPTKNAAKNQCRQWQLIRNFWTPAEFLQEPIFILGILKMPN